MRRRMNQRVGLTGRRPAPLLAVVSSEGRCSRPASVGRRAHAGRLRVSDGSAQPIGALRRSGVCWASVEQAAATSRRARGAGRIGLVPTRWATPGFAVLGWRVWLNERSSGRAAQGFRRGGPARRASRTNVCTGSAAADRFTGLAARAGGSEAVGLEASARDFGGAREQSRSCAVQGDLDRGLRRHRFDNGNVGFGTRGWFESGFVSQRRLRPRGLVKRRCDHRAASAARCDEAGAECDARFRSRRARGVGFAGVGRASARTARGRPRFARVEQASADSARREAHVVIVRRASARRSTGDVADARNRRWVPFGVRVEWPPGNWRSQASGG